MQIFNVRQIYCLHSWKLCNITLKTGNLSEIVANLKQLKGRKERVRCHSFALYLGVKMDGTIDTLNIQITADTRDAERSVASLKRALSNLDTVLGSFRNLGTFSNAMSGISESINEFSSAINSIDASKVQSLASSMKTITSATRGLASGTGKLSFTRVESEANGFKKEIDSMTKTIQKDFGVSNSNVDGLRERVIALAKATNEVVTNKDTSKSDSLFDTYAKSMDELASYIERNKRVVTGFDSTYQSVVDNVMQHSNGMKISIASMVNEVGEDYDRLRRKISNKYFTTGDSGFGFDSWIKSLDPSTLSVIDGEVERMGGRVGDLGARFEAVAEIMGRWRDANRNGVAEMSIINSTAEGLRATVTGAAQSFETLSMAEGRVASIGQTETVNAFHSMAEGLNQFQSVSLTNVGQISELASAIKSLGYASSEKAIVNIPKLAVALNGLMETLSKAPTVSANVNKLLNSLARFNESMKVYNATARSTKTSNGMLNSSFLNLNKGVRKANTGFKGLASTIGKIYATYWLFFRLFSKLGEAINLSSQLTEVENVVNQTFGDMRSKIDEFASTSINKFGMSELALKQYASRFQAMGTAMDITGSMLESTTSVLGDADRQYGKLTGSMAEMSVNLTKLTADMASFYDVEQSAVAEDLYSVFTGQTRSLRQYGIDLTEVNLKEWAMKKGLDANFDAMSQAQKAALRYAYTLDAAKYAMGDFERTSDTWANSVRILKANLQQLAIVIGTGFINALKPLLRGLNTALQAITSFATKVLNALGQIFGWKYEINLGGVTTELDDAAGYSDDLSDGLGGAAKNAKELKNQLRGFDKLNVLTSDKDNGGGGKGSSASGGGGGALDDSDLIKAAKVGEGLFRSSIKNLEELGKYISNSMSRAMESINWNEVYKKAEGFGSGLASFMNGQFAGEAGKRLFKNVGKTIAGALNVVGEAINAYAETFKWDEFGDNLGEGINSFFKNWKPILLGTSFYRLANGILDAIINALDTVNWELVGTKIGQFLSSLKFEKIVKKMAVALGKAISGIFTMVKFSFKQAPIETALLTAFALLNFTRVGKLISSLFLTKMFGKTGMITLAVKGILLNVGNSIKWQGATLLAILKDAIAGSLGIQASSITAALTGFVIPYTVTVAIGMTILNAITNEQVSNALGGDEWDIFKEKVENLSLSVKDLGDSFNYLGNEYDLALKNADSEAEMLSGLAGRYEELSSKTNLTATEKEQLQNVVQSLISSVPELSQYYDAESGTLQTTTEKVLALINAEKEELKLAAKKEYYIELEKKRLEATQAMTEAYDAWQESMRKYTETINDSSLTMEARKKLEEELKKEMQESGQAWSDAADMVDKYATAENDITEELYGTRDAADAQTFALKEMNDAIRSGDDARANMWKDLLGIRGQLDDVTGSVNANEKAIESSTTTSGKNVNNFTKNANSDLNGTKVKADDLTKAIGEVKTQSDMSNATGNIKNFAGQANTDLQGTKQNTDNLFNSVGDLKRQSDMSGASSNIQNFTSITDSGMKGTKTNVDNAKTSVDNMKTSTQDLLKYNNQTFSIKKDETAFKSLGDALSGFLQALKDIFSFDGKTVTINQVTNSSTSGGGKSKKADGGVFSNGHWQNIAKYAYGGLPMTGQMFIARERGPELVGTLGGNTAVMNNDQIVASVSAGVYQAVASAMRQYGGSNVNVTLQGDAGDLFRAVQTESNRYYGRTGRSPFPT